MRGIKIPLQDFAIKIQGELMREGWAYLWDTMVVRKIELLRP